MTEYDRTMDITGLAPGVERRMLIDGQDIHVKLSTTNIIYEDSESLDNF